jgi:ATP-dependent helicase/nuclease subunit B
MALLEAPGSCLGEYDGFVGSFSEYWDDLFKQGVSPTALERYALCPFQFFARNILGLGWLERPEETTHLGPSEIGDLAHVLLKLFFQELIDGHYFGEGKSSVDVRAVLETSAQKAFSDYELRNAVGYQVPWETLREQLRELLWQVIVRDLQELSESGYRPFALEVEAKAQLKGEWPVPLEGFVIRGRMDRIDHQHNQGHYRVIDYKVKTGRNRLAEDNNLARSAIRGQRLQPPLYLILAKRFLTHQEEVLQPTVAAAFYYLAPEWPEGPLTTEILPADAWKGQLGAGLKETVSLLLEGIRRGRFFIRPGGYCNHCEVSEVCRKNHLPTRWRVENDPVTGPHRDLRQKSLPKESADKEKGPRPRR